MMRATRMNRSVSAGLGTWWLVSLFAPGGIERSTSGTAINVDANGTSTVAPEDLKRVVFRRFAEMREIAAAVDPAAIA
jgi:hypothetical protein